MAKIKDEDLRLNIIINGDNGRKEILDLEKSIKDTTVSLKDMNARAREMEKNGEAGSSKYKKLEAQIKKTNATIDEQKKRLDTLNRNLDVNRMTLSELQKHIKLTRAALSNAVPGTENWRRLNEELRLSVNRQKELTTQSKATYNTMCQLAGKLADFVIALRGPWQSLQGLRGYIKQTTDAYQEYDEALTDAMKTTNLGKDEITALSERLKKLDTKTAQNELLALVRAGGKLGIEGVDNLLGFTRAADKINVALSDDLGGDAEAAITAIGKMTDIFNLQDGFGVEKAMLKVGSAINELGMASTANEGYIVDFSKRLAGIAPNADISIDRVLGMAATLDKYGQQAETSSTAIGQTIMAMFKRTETFAGIAKMPLQEFAELLNKDVNEALLRVLEGMNDGNGLSSVVAAMDEMHLNGQRASTVLGTLSKNVDELRSQQQLANQAFEDGISLDNEFETKNTSVTASMEKMKNAIHNNVVEIGQELMPIVRLSTSLADVGLRTLASLVSLIMKYKAACMAAAAVLAVYNAAKKISALHTLEHRKALVAELATMRHAKASTLALAVVQNVLAGSFRAAGVAVKLFGKALLANPIGLIVAGLTAVIAAFVHFVSKSREATKGLRELNKQTKDTASGFVEAKSKIDQERTAMERLREAVLKAASGSRERAAAIKAINDKYGDYLPKLLTERSSNEEIETALRNVNAQLEKKILLQAKENAEIEIYQHRSAAIKAALEGLGIQYKKNNGMAMSSAAIKTLTDDLKTYYDMFSRDSSEWDMWGANDAFLQLHETLKSLGLETGKAFKDIGVNQLLNEFNTAIDKGKELRAVTDGLYGSVNSGSGDNGSENGTMAGGTGQTVTDGGSGDGSNEKWSLSKDKEYQERLLALKKDYLAGELQSEKEYNDAVLQLEIDTLNKRLGQTALSAEERMSIESQLQDKLIQCHKEAEKDREAIEKEGAKIVAEVTSDKLKEEEDWYKEQKRKFAGNASVLESLERLHQTKVSKIHLDALNERISAEDKNHKLAVATVKNRHAAEIAAFTGTKKELVALKKRQEDELAAVDLEYAGKLKGMLQELQSLDGDIDVRFNGLSDAELTSLKTKIQELVALKNEMEGNGNTSDGDSSDDGTGKTMKKGAGGGSFLNVGQEEWSTFFENIKNGENGAQTLATAVKAVGAAAQEAIGLMSVAAERQTAIEQNQLKEYKKSQDQKKKALEKRLDAGLMTEAQYNAECEAMDAEYDAYQEELQLKQAKRNKQLQLTQAIINTALGVTQTLAQFGVPAGLIPAGVMLAMGAAEIAMIASTPITTGAEEGGEQFVEREQDGKRFKARLSPDKRGFIGAPTLLVGENGTEYVIPNDGVENPTLAPILNTIEAARKNGTLKSLNFESIYPTSAPGREAGGYSQPSAVQEQGREYPSTQQDVTGDEQLKQLLQKLSDRLDRPIEASVSMLGRNGLIENYSKYEKYKKRGQLR